MKFFIASIAYLVTINCALFVNAIAYEWYDLPKAMAPNTIITPSLCLNRGIDLRTKTLSFFFGKLPTIGSIIDSGFTPVDAHGKPVRRKTIKVQKDGTQIPYCYKFQIEVPAKVKIGKSYQLTIKRKRKLLWKILLLGSAVYETKNKIKVTKDGIAPPTLLQKITGKYTKSGQTSGSGEQQGVENSQTSYLAQSKYVPPPRHDNPQVVKSYIPYQAAA